VQFKDGLLEIDVPKHPDEVDRKPELKKIDIKARDDR
jgi:HSP20 family molecular chaperone IbpA